MSRSRLNTICNIAISAVWLINGLFCKVLNFTPRHTEIVASILGRSHARLIAVLIGLAETIMALWILSRFKPRIIAIVQIIVIAVMNALEFILVPGLLLWGKWNSVFAFLFIVLIGVNEFWLRKSDDKKVTLSAGSGWL